MHLVKATRKRCQKLNEWVVTKDPLHPERLAVAFRAEGDDLKNAIRGLKGGGFIAVLDGTRRDKCRLVGGLQRSFGERVVRLRP